MHAASNACNMTFTFELNATHLENIGRIECAKLVIKCAEQIQVFE